MSEPPKLGDLLKLDGYLNPYKTEICRRYGLVTDFVKKVEESEKSLVRFCSGYEDFGIHRQKDNSICCIEWAPGAKNLYLNGDFNDWNKTKHKFESIGFGKWKLVIPPLSDGSCAIKHLSKVKLVVETNSGCVDRLSPWAPYVVAPPIEEQQKGNTLYDQLFYDPPSRYTLKHPHPPKPASLRIYECHVGICTPEPKIATYTEFADTVVPRISELGYNAIQLMAVMEHAYYASFGYQITSFFAASSRFGKPDELRYLVDKAHSYGISVILDVVHSHASKNVLDGLNQFDGTNGCYFHDNARGFHDLWDSRMFDYTQWEVMRFLLSNLRWWIEEYGVDGFRFDGVMSIIYHHHGLNHNFSGHYDEYFGPSVDTEGLSYLAIANYFLHKTYPDFIISIAEEVSGMPALCRPIAEGGTGFDYRMGMGLPDMWIKLCSKVKLQYTPPQDEDWNVETISATLSNRRYREPTVAYAECHDQALVGDKTLAFWYAMCRLCRECLVFT